MPSNRWFTYGLAVILGLSLIINVAALNRLADLNRRLDQLQGSLVGQVNALQSALAGQLRQMEDADRWYSQPRLEITGVGGSGTAAQARLTWTFHELQVGAQVGMSYRVGDGEWTEAPVTLVNGATYQADLSVPIEVTAANFSIGVESGGGRSSTVQEESSGPRSMMEYVIHATEQGRRRSGAPEQVDIGKLAGFFVVRITAIEPGQRYSATVYREGGVSPVEPSAIEFWAAGPADELGRVQLSSEQKGERFVWTGTLDLGRKADVQGLGVNAVLANGQEVTRMTRMR